MCPNLNRLHRNIIHPYKSLINIKPSNKKQPWQSFLCYNFVFLMYSTMLNIHFLLSCCLKSLIPHYAAEAIAEILCPGCIFKVSCFWWFVIFLEVLEIFYLFWKPLQCQITVKKLSKTQGYKISATCNAQTKSFFCYLHSFSSLIPISSSRASFSGRIL